MSFNFFNSSYFQQKETLALPIEQSPQKENHELYNNERSFLSDFNIEEELFAGMSTGGPHSTSSQNYSQKNVQNTNHILPVKNIVSDHKGFKQNYQQQIPHQNNEVLNKLVGTKRRKIAPQLEQEQINLQLEQAYEVQNNRQLLKQLQSTVNSGQQRTQGQNVINNFPNLQNMLNESMNSSMSSMDPIFIPPKHRQQNYNANNRGCTGGPASSHHSSLREGVDPQGYYGSSAHHTNDNLDESGMSMIEDVEQFNNKNKKRQQNKESAVRSRLKKKAYYESIEGELNTVQLENNKLKLDNAALRAENQVLRQYLDYFEDIFRRKNQIPTSNVSNSNSIKDLSHSTKGGYTPQMYSGPSSRQGGLSDDEIYNSRAQLYPFNIRNRGQLRQNINSAHNTNTDEIYSQISADNEAPRGLQSQKISSKATNQDNNAEVSFVLERKDTDSTGSNSPGKMGMFTIALVMCVCCFSSFFTPGSQDAQVSASGKYNGLGRNIMAYKQAQDDSQPLLMNLNMQQAQIDQQATLFQQQQHQQQQQQQQQISEIQTFSMMCWSNFLKVIFLVFFAILILTFPLDDIKQWAARKAWLRKIFNLNDIPINANKNIKNL